MKTIAIIITTIFSLLILTSGTTTTDFETLLQNIKDPNLKKRLTTFMQQGIEKYHPLGYNSDSLLQAALQYKGARYRYGSAGKKAMDCSGLIFRSGKDIGIDLPHQSLELARYGKVIAHADSLKKGDMVFFKSRRRFIGHTGIMVDNRHFVHMSIHGGWTISAIDEPYYARTILFGTREYLEKVYPRDTLAPLKTLNQIPAVPVNGRSLILTAGLPR